MQIDRIVLKILRLSAKDVKYRCTNATQIVIGLENDAMKQELRLPLNELDECIAIAQCLIQSKQRTERQLFSLTEEWHFSAVAYRALFNFKKIVFSNLQPI